MIIKIYQTKNHKKNNKNMSETENMIKLLKNIKKIQKKILIQYKLWNYMKKF